MVFTCVVDCFDVLVYLGCLVYDCILDLDVCYDFNDVGLVGVCMDCHCCVSCTTLIGCFVNDC